MDKKNNTVSTPFSLRDVVITDAFWKQKLELVRTEVIPYQWEALNDRIPEAAPSYCMRNFKVAGRINKARREQGDKFQPVIWPLNTFETLPADKEHMEERFYGFLFQDSDFAKWIEAVGYSLTQYPDSELEKTADEAIDIVCAAQQENGYLDTYYIINDMSKVFTNLRDNHELYCFGHLVEGAVTYYQATGKDKLLNAAKRYADYIASCFGSEEGKIKGYPGHEIAEMALVRLYEVTNEQKYLDLGKFFLDERGTRPYFFDKEHPETVKKGHEDELRNHYHQAHLPVREQEEAVGHAVRAVYLYSGMADAARLTGDEKLSEACKKLWNNITEKKMYITGGIGGTHVGEAFSYNYDLPDDTAYAETCASIGLVFFARRMLEMDMDSRYADVMERALYNGVLSGMALDGKSFFYVNPLSVVPEACHNDARKFHVKPVRQKWFGCACCPPNIARLVSSIASYAYTENEDTLFVHLYAGGKVTKQIGNVKADFEITSGFPWNGAVSIKSSLTEDAEYTLALRIPAWCSNYKIAFGCKDAAGISMQSAEAGDGIFTGSAVMNDAQCEVKKGYLYITKKWSDQETVWLDFAMPVRLMQANAQVREDEGKLAVTRGPIVYCLEEADNGKNLHRLILNPKGKAELVNAEGLDEGTVMITIPGWRNSMEPKDADNRTGELYREFHRPDGKETTLKYIPYYAWANRGEGEMQVWTRY